MGSLRAMSSWAAQIPMKKSMLSRLRVTWRGLRMGHTRSLLQPPHAAALWADDDALPDATPLLPVVGGAVASGSTCLFPHIPPLFPFRPLFPLSHLLNLCPFLATKTLRTQRKKYGQSHQRGPLVAAKANPSRCRRSNHPHHINHTDHANN